MNKICAPRKVIRTYICNKRQIHSNINDGIEISRKVSAAIRDKMPMVALESTVVTHGMSWPINFKTAQSLENIIASENAVPVTIGIFRNKIKAGFDNYELEELARSVGPKKVSRRDLYNVRNINYGGTTVSGTMVIAEKLGIKVFATGGIGGVHRDSENTMDISADLRELGRTPVCVVSSGVKSFLDISKTLEYLETEGVFVCTLSSDDFPGFFLKSSGLRSPHRVDTIEEASHIIIEMEKLNISSGMILAVPIPDFLEKDGGLINDAIERSIRMTKEMNISGSEVTPFVLSKVCELTNGRSLQLNIELIKNNAKIGGKLAFHLHKLRKPLPRSTTNLIRNNSSEFVVIGGSIVDNNLRFLDSNIKNCQHLITQASYRCVSSQTCGGVARNMADVFSRLGERCHFLSAIADDLSAEYLRKDSKYIDWSRVKIVHDSGTSNCSILMFSNKDIFFHLGNFEIANQISKSYVKKELENIKDNLKLICCDCNLASDTLEHVVEFAKNNNIKVFIEPTDILLISKAIELLVNNQHYPNPIDIISPNMEEFLFLYNLLKSNKDKYKFTIKDGEPNQGSAFEHVKFIMHNSNLLDLIPHWIIKLGRSGVMFASKEELFFIKQSMFLIKNRDIVSASGAGDCLAACALFLHFKVGLTWQESIVGGIRMAKESLEDERTVPSSIDSNKYAKISIQSWIKEMFDNKMISFIH